MSHAHTTQDRFSRNPCPDLRRKGLSRVARDWAILFTKRHRSGGNTCSGHGGKSLGAGKPSVVRSITTWWSEAARKQNSKTQLEKPERCLLPSTRHQSCQSHPFFYRINTGGRDRRPRLTSSSALLRGSDAFQARLMRLSSKLCLR